MLTTAGNLSLNQSPAAKLLTLRVVDRRALTLIAPCPWALLLTAVELSTALLRLFCDIVSLRVEVSSEMGVGLFS